MSAGFSSVEYVFNANRTLPANAALGIFSAADSNAGYGTGGDDTAAINAALSSAIAAGGAVAFLPPPPSGVLRISSQLITGAAWLVGASPGVTIQVIPGSNLDWAVSSGAHDVVDYRTVCIVNRRTQTLGGNSYTLYDPANPAQLFTGGGLMNLTFQGDPAQIVGLGHGALYNAALDLQLFNCFFQNFIGEGVSLWDCARTRLVGVYSTGCGRTVGVHRACYDVSVLGSHGIGGPNPSYLAYTEQFQVPNGPLLTLSPQYTKFVDAHHYSSVQSVSGFDLEGAAFVNLTGCTADNVLGALPYQTGTRFSKPTYQVLADVNPISVAVTAPIVNTGSPTAPNIGLTTPLAIALGGTGTATPTFAATAPVTFSGTWPNITVALSTPLAVSFGGTGTTTPGLVQGTGITITGSWPNQTIAAALALSQLTDALVSGPSDGQVLTWVASASKWENKAAGGGLAVYDSVISAEVSLTHQYKCAETHTAMTLADSKGSQVLTLNGNVRAGEPAVVNDGSGSILGMGAAGDTISFPSSTFIPAVSGPFSIEFWCTPSFAGATVQVLFGSDSGSSIVIYRENTNIVKMLIANTARASTFLFPTTAKNHIVYTWDGTTSVLYVNAFSVLSGAFAPTFGTSGSGTFFAYTGGQPTQGYIHKIAAYSAALSAASVLAHYVAGAQLL